MDRLFIFHPLVGVRKEFIHQNLEFLYYYKHIVFLLICPILLCLFYGIFQNTGHKGVDN